MLLASNNSGIIQQNGGWMNRAKIATLHKAVLAACDAFDGLPDGIISAYKKCVGRSIPRHFDAPMAMMREIRAFLTPKFLLSKDSTVRSSMGLRCPMGSRAFPVGIMAVKINHSACFKMNHPELAWVYCWQRIYPHAKRRSWIRSRFVANKTGAKAGQRTMAAANAKGQLR
jgi:hypothetical protein